MVEAFGGAGYVEDTGIPRLLRDAQVLPYLGGHHQRAEPGPAARRVQGGGRHRPAGDLAEQLAAARAAPAPGVDAEAVERSHAALLAHVRAWPDATGDALQAQLRGFALRLSRSYAAALLTAARR